MRRPTKEPKEAGDFLIIPDLACVAGNLQFTLQGNVLRCGEGVWGISEVQSVRTKGAAPAVTSGGSEDGSVTHDLLDVDLEVLVPLNPQEAHTHKLAYSYKVLVQTSGHGD